MLVVLSLVIGSATAAMAVLLPLCLPYQRLLRRWLRSTARGTRRRDPPRVYWQAGRWDTDPSHAYVANIGDETAYEVSVTACDHVVGKTPSVPPYRSDRISSSLELPYYVIFCVGQWSKREISVGARTTHGGQDDALDSGESEVVIRVCWRSENNEWLNQTVRAT